MHLLLKSYSPQLGEDDYLFVHLNCIMDSEHPPLPIPMHRPILIEDARYDTLLPFRRDLTHVNKRMLEYEAPYSLLQVFRLSMLERLPTEIRMRVYVFLGIDAFVSPCNHDESHQSHSPLLLRHTHYCLPLSEQLFAGEANILLETNILRVNRNIRAEVLDIMSRRYIMQFDYHLSNKKTYYNNWQSHKFIP
jgi:hypothetical protein